MCVFDSFTSEERIDGADLSSIERFRAASVRLADRLGFALIVAHGPGEVVIWQGTDLVNGGVIVRATWRAVP